MSFKIGDRVGYTAEMIKLCAPTITESEYQGEVMGVVPHSDVEPPRLLVQFDNGECEWTPAHWFEKLEGLDHEIT